MPNSAGKVSGGNEGQVDTNRGISSKFQYSMDQRNTGKTGSVGTEPNSNTVDGNKEVATDSRLTPSS